MEISCLTVAMTTTDYRSKITMTTVKATQGESRPVTVGCYDYGCHGDEITMTTVGYGDKVPVGAFGKMIGSACAITGVLTLAIPVPIITGHFNRFYSHKTGRGRYI